MSKTIKQLAQESLDIQSACNLCAIAQAFARAMIDLGEHTSGTQARNTHPITILWADKIAHLTGTQTFGTYAVSAAYDEIYAMLEEEPVKSDKPEALGF